MSTAFKEFLREKAQRHQAENGAARPTIDEWRSAIERLFAQVREWLKESDPNGVIEIEESEQEINEPGLGLYRAPRLNLRAFGKWIGIIPKARRTVASASPPRKTSPERAEGRVDITDELHRFVLYRFVQDGQDLWLIDGLENGPEEVADASWPGQVRHGRQSRPVTLDQEAFEKALMSYLR